jgi:hypothetical protein
VSLNPVSAYLAAERGIAKITSDPIAAFRFSSEGQRDATRALTLFEETGVQTSNQWGKTTWAGHAFVGMMRGVKEFCGDVVGIGGYIKRGDPVALPLLGTPVRFLQLSQGREMWKDSVKLCLDKAVGDHPHHWELQGGVATALWVKPDLARTDDWRTWSSMRFFVEAGQSVAGMRLDGAWADEPPDWDLWQEIRMRGRANRPFVRVITYTPVDKRTWKPIREDFKGCAWPRGKGGKVVIRQSVYDNKALSKEHIKAVERAAAGSGALKKAKLYGDFCDTTGSNPFDAEGLKRWADRCKPGVEHRGLTPSATQYSYEVWEKPTDGEGYFIIADPSAGIEDEAKEHDPAGIVVVTRSKPYAVVARYNGYMPSRDLGWLAARLAQEYNRALLVWERNSGYGESFFHGIGRYGNVYVEHHHDARGLPLSQRIGWTTTATTRGTIVGALQKAILQDGLLVYSAEAVDSLGSVVLKRDGLRPEAGAGAHDEDMIVLGLACHLLETLPFYRRKPEKGSEKLVRELGMRLRGPAPEKDPFAPAW